MTPFSFQVLRRLADGEFHSGAALAHALGVSRGTVWNAVRAIGAVGLEVYRVRGRGYKLSEAVSLLERTAISRPMGARASRFAIDVIEHAESTSTLLMQRAGEGAAAGAVVAAEWQTCGRGRFGRPWHAGLGGALTFSVLWRFARGAGALAGLSLAAGVALIRALTGLGIHDARLKWPNDVLWRGGKLAGMLIEMQGDALGPSAVVIGIGMNIRLSETLRQAIDQPAVDLETACGRAMDRNEVLGLVLDQLAHVLDGFSVDGFAALREEWERYHAHQDQAIEVTHAGGRSERGIARGVAEDGALLFETAAGVRRLHSGEIRVRAAPREAGHAASRAPAASRPA